MPPTQRGFPRIVRGSAGEAHYLATAEQRYAELNRGYFGWTLAWDDKVPQLPHVHVIHVKDVLLMDRSVCG